jgi:16S rRNA (cytidine1402-2'-O)-methyltransferase
MNGTLYLVATPIGNLEDITLRALRVLGEADLIACEDTRHSRKLLEHYRIRKPLVSYHAHNEQARAAELIRELEAGQRVALITDAGSPLVSDPGYRLVTMAVERGIRVEPVPGPSAAIAALSASGLPTDSFHFRGFLPAQAGKRRKAIEAMRATGGLWIFYEAPHRILAALAEVNELCGNCRAVVARELTKTHEEFLRGSLEEVHAALAARPAIKGEMTVLIEMPEPAASAEPTMEAGRLATPLEEVEALLRQGCPRTEAVKTVARRRGIARRELYRQVQESSVPGSLDQRDRVP